MVEESGHASRELPSRPAHGHGREGHCDGDPAHPLSPSLRRRGCPSGWLKPTAPALPHTMQRPPRPCPARLQGCDVQAAVPSGPACHHGFPGPLPHFRLSREESMFKSTPKPLVSPLAFPRTVSAGCPWPPGCTGRQFPSSRGSRVCHCFPRRPLCRHEGRGSPMPQRQASEGVLPSLGAGAEVQGPQEESLFR